VLKEAKGYYYLITFHPDGTYSGKAYGNEMMGGEYKLNGKEIQINHAYITQLDFEGSDPDQFFLEHLTDVYTYTIADTELRLYYSKDQYFRFRINDNKSDDVISNGNQSETNNKTAPPDSSIVGTWILHIIYNNHAGTKVEVPIDQGDSYMFNLNGKVKFVKKINEDFFGFPKEDGEYDYSYDKENQRLQLYGKTRACTIKDGEMRIGDEYIQNHYPCDSKYYFLFVKQQN
jgi:hypothetical protein